MSIFKKYILGEKKCHLQCQSEIANYVLANYAVDCDFHAHIKQDMVRNMTHLIGEKVEFRSEQDFRTYNTIIRGEVYVLSPTDMRTLDAAIEAELAAVDSIRLLYRLKEAEVAELKDKLAEIEKIAKKGKK